MNAYAGKKEGGNSETICPRKEMQYHCFIMDNP